MKQPYNRCSLWTTIGLMLSVFSFSVTAQVNRAEHKKSVPYKANYQRMATGCSSASSFEIRNGALWAWGYNESGQLGDGTNISKNTPVQTGSETNWISISSSYRHTMGLKADGTLWAWGINEYGQLGDGTNTSRNSPVQIGSETQWISVACGHEQTIGLQANGTLWAWGHNYWGQLGDGTNTDKNRPVQIGSDTRWVSIASGAYHTIGLKADGTLWAWGYNWFGQLGDGTTGNKNSPVQIGNEYNWVSIAGGFDHTMGLKADGTLWAWGNNEFGQLGDGTNTNRISPLQIGSDTKWVSIAGGGNFTVALQANGTLWTWGNNDRAQLGDGTYTQRSVPGQVGSDTIWVSIAASAYHTLGLKADGTLWTWGGNASGELGNGTNNDSNIPIQIRNAPDEWLMIDAGELHSMGIRANGTLWAWGSNSAGQLGDGTNTDRNSPVQIGTDNKWVCIAADFFHTVGLKADGTLWAWGTNEYGQLGDGTNTSKNSPVQIGSETNWVSIDAGRFHSVGLKSDGTLWGWGYNAHGQLGDGTNTDKNSPEQIGNGTQWVSIVCGYYHVVGLKADGTLWSWGSNMYGQLGDGSTTDKNSPVQIGEANQWISIVSGGYHNMALTSEGTLWAWGSNGYGQLGDGNSIGQENSPIQIANGAKWVNIATGEWHSLGLQADGTLWSWGQNDAGQLGDGTNSNKNQPIQIVSQANVVSVVGGSGFSGIIKSARESFCMTGKNDYGQLGNSTNTNTSVFVCSGAIASPAPTLGTYPNATVIAGQNTTITPSGAPANTTSIVASTNTNFTGVLSVNPATGVVTVTDAKQAGLYIVTVKAFGSGTATQTFNLTITNPDCSQGRFRQYPSVGLKYGGGDIVIGDFNEDGWQDIAVTEYHEVSIRLGDGNGGFTGTTQLIFSGYPQTIAVGDFNGDGKQDLAIGAGGSVLIRLGNGAGGFSEGTEVTVGNDPQSIGVGDFNGDGKQDLAVANYRSGSVSIRIGDGLGGFSGNTFLDLGVLSYPVSVAIGDFNGDGMQDIATVKVGHNAVSIHLGNGLGAFTGGIDVVVGKFPFFIAIGDFNEDGKQDIATANRDSASVSIRMGNGNGGFTGNTEVAVGEYPRSVEVGDFNGDGHQDIVAANDLGSSVSIRFGDGLGGFSGENDVYVGKRPFKLAVGDFNGDGHQDIAVPCGEYIYDYSFGRVSVLVGGMAEINAEGNGTTIVDGDNNPDSATHTDFGKVNMGSSLTHTFTIQNKGKVPLSITKISSSNPSFKLDSVPTNVDPCCPEKFNVTFSPIGVGNQNATITIQNDDCDEAEYDFAVSGLGIEVLLTWYRDSDGDGYGDARLSKVSATKPRGYVDNNLDCKDWDNSIHPGGFEIEDGKDNDCDGEVDEGLTCRILWYLDGDKDGFGRNSTTRWSCVKPDNYSLVGGDCNDYNATINPGAIELGDGKDNDCDGVVDDGLACLKPWYLDGDGDGYGRNTSTTIRMSCVRPNPIYVEFGGDCKDYDRRVYPGHGCAPITSIDGETIQPKAMVETTYEVLVYPNPAKDEIMVTLNGFEAGIKLGIVLMQVDGRVVATQSLVPVVHGQQVRMDVRTLGAGYYLLQVKQGIQSEVKRVIISR